MSIQALPQSTVRALGATQALTDPASLVKELLDNALDANANSVAISISNNTLDVIQVRDNGHGIAPRDRKLVARRYCTSKICDDGDLKDIGGSSLGFRGEALASAAELSGSLMISTRIEGEQVATLLKISQQGEVVGEERASLPVGTTVKITDFIKSNPVRRQVTLKNVDSCLKKIKRLLQAYAFARPHVRLSLQVIKAKNKANDWVYAPKPGGNAEDAAFKIVGAACASACLWSVVEDQGLTLQAFLPRPDADVSKISNIGSFLSIDARPVSSARGLLKQITKVYRESLKSIDSKFDSVKDPFIFLEISGGSYDANLEPAKDDVLFENADIVLQIVRQFFAAVYQPVAPEAAVAEESEFIPIGHPVAEEEGGEPFTSLEDEMPTAAVQGGPSHEDTHKDAAEDWIRRLDVQQSPQISPTPAHARGPPARSNMYGFDEDDLKQYDDRPSTGITEADLAELRQSRKDVTLSNPWVLAKMNTSTRTPLLDDGHDSVSLNRNARLAVAATRESSPTRPRHGAGLPTPRPSSPSPSLDTSNPPDGTLDFRAARSTRLTATPELAFPQNYTPVPSNEHHGFGDGAMTIAAARVYPYTLGRDAAEGSAGTRLSDIPDAITRPRGAAASRINKPFVPPSKNNSERERVWFDNPGDVRKTRSQRARRGNIDELVAQGELDDSLEDIRPLTPPRRNRDIRDFVGPNASSSISSMIERRNFGQTPLQREPSHDDDESVVPVASMEPVRQHPGFVPASKLVDLEATTSHVEKQSSRMCKRRKTADRAPLRELSTNTPPETIEPEDEAEYQPEAAKRVSSRRRSSKGTSRTKSSRLPLERIPPDQAMHEVILNVSTDVENLRELAGRMDQETSLLGYEELLDSRVSAFDEMEDDDIEALTATLHRLLVTAGYDTDAVDSTDLFKEAKVAIYARSAIDTDSDTPMSSA